MKSLIFMVLFLLSLCLGETLNRHYVGIIEDVKILDVTQDSITFWIHTRSKDLTLSTKCFSASVALGDSLFEYRSEHNGLINYTYGIPRGLCLFSKDR